MFEENKVLTTLTSKVNDLLEKYDEVTKTNEDLHNQIVTLKAQNEAKTNQIARLEEELNKKNSETDDVLKKIEAVLGK
ncbi:hypothetical protein CCAL9344_00900 [Campylobacter sp. RM9344]|uniref:Cell division protein ZapB n=1 Tax=Campylobacter californiensis TaxID=1032243 RepID=A0AAW3ZT62_9BACT|nr:MULTISPECIES: hypothetical protein [unclassified Campylobacter]MBE2983909.1 hypothetical protein [Campylobacter sp. RM6883]MBE2986071.1 hypothetical protein [Campylobacter sp. RM12919]MBE2987484.1 hypothetical protein [Campylobacter sp. RM12920]MBE2994447.1 hypothetical protein [Campylobacter sp. RM6913]MBE3022594.1 hypothetical protein [Campylobacter sp. 7477a]MBE3028755.1 hypothetical protein [Campylobacter sp. RM9344]